MHFYISRRFNVRTLSHKEHTNNTAIFILILVNPKKYIGDEYKH